MHFSNNLKINRLPPGKTPVKQLQLSMVLALGFCVLSPFTWALEALQPTATQVQTHRAILRELMYEHYRQLAIDDTLSQKMYREYLNQLDSQKSFFLADDIASISQYEFKLDDALKQHNLKIGFEIYNLFRKRAHQRYTTLLNWLDQDISSFDFTINETFTLDRENSHWAKNTAELHNVWRKQLKNQILRLKLADKPEKDILDTLKKRYQNQLNRLLKNDSDDVFQAYMNAIIQPYDPHTQYFDPRTTENFNINMSLSLEGIGAVLKTDGEHTKVVRLVAAGPADKSQLLHPADRIVAVGQGKTGELTNVIGWRIDEVVDLIRGPKGTEVRLEIIPAKNKTLEDTTVISLKRDKVKLEEQAAKSDVLNIKHNNQSYKIGVIDLPTFYIDFKALREKDPNYRSTTRDVKALINKLTQDKVEGIVIDLRNNGGGSLQEANTLLGLFIEQGPTVQIRDDKGRVEILRDRDKRVFSDGPIVVMVNRLSASASEIFAAAIQDYQRGILVGTPTFGKGTVQALRPLEYGQLKITQAKFYRISGGSNQYQGVSPDILFPSLYDPTEIGESTNQHAMMWDTIRPARHKTYGNLKPLLSQLSEQHQNRIKTDPEFQYLLSQLALTKTIDGQQEVSLQETERRKQYQDIKDQRLGIENTRRKAKGLEPLASLDDSYLNDDQDLNGDESGPATENQDGRDEDGNRSGNEGEEEKPDAMLYEAAHILLDYHIHNERVAVRH